MAKVMYEQTDRNAVKGLRMFSRVQPHHQLLRQRDVSFERCGQWVSWLQQNGSTVKISFNEYLFTEDQTFNGRHDCWAVPPDAGVIILIRKLEMIILGMVANHVHHTSSHRPEGEQACPLEGPPGCGTLDKGHLPQGQLEVAAERHSMRLQQESTGWTDRK